ncbi:MAG: hypothetical protein PHF63_10950 [Herbinix sp.]|nr:hypothetical protein [Herbinix sp.]
MKKKLLLTAFSFLVLLGFTACNKLDVIGDKSIISFDAVIKASGNQVTEDSGFGGWSLEAPDKTARLVWSKDYSKTSSLDVFIETDVQPFIDAGLDTSKLPEGMLLGDKIVVGTDMGNDTLTYDGDATPLASYKQIVNLYRGNLKYHATLDHFGIDMTNGNMFEWAKNMATNDKDMVFVLNPQVFIDAGVDPNKVNGWVFAKVETMDAKGKKIQVDKLLKPFDLDGKN